MDLKTCPVHAYSNHWQFQFHIIHTKREKINRVRRLISHLANTECYNSTSLTKCEKSVCSYVASLRNLCYLPFRGDHWHCRFQLRRAILVYNSCPRSYNVVLPSIPFLLYASDPTVLCFHVILDRWNLLDECRETEELTVLANESQLSFKSTQFGKFSCRDCESNWPIFLFCSNCFSVVHTVALLLNVELLSVLDGRSFEDSFVFRFCFSTAFISRTSRFCSLIMESIFMVMLR